MSKETQVRPDDKTQDGSFQKKPEKHQKLQKASTYFPLETRLLQESEIVYKMQEILGYEFVGSRIRAVRGRVTPKSIKQILVDADQEVQFFISKEGSTLKYVENTTQDSLPGYKKMSTRKTFKNYPLQKIYQARMLGSCVL